MIAVRAATLLLLLGCCAGGGKEPPPAVRVYYVAAVEVGWDYVHLDGTDPAASEQRFKDPPQKYVKAIYREYTDSTYTVPKPRPAWTGIQGPAIVAQAGERVVVHFKNLASQPYSISPVGITYWKQSEGAGYDDSTAGHEKEDDAVSPGGYYEYVWDISPKDGPTASDPECLTYSYSSQVDTVRDLNSGLIGALLICQKSAFKTDGQRRNPAFVLLFVVFDETKSWYGEVGERKNREKFKKSIGRKEYHTINGYVNGTLPGLTMCQGRDRVMWHLIGMGTAPEIHSIQFQDHTLRVLDNRKTTVEVTPMSFITAEMRPATMGRFLMSCQIHAHRHYGMEAFFTVEKCTDPVVVPGPDLRNAKHEDHVDDSDYNNDDGENLFNTVHFLSKPQVQARASGGQPRGWRHYIAVEEVIWDYNFHLKPTVSEAQSGHLVTPPHHLGYKYKKAVYVEYTDGSFAQRKDPARTMLGPLLKGKVNDQIQITFRNLASRPFNIYPNGLSKIFPLFKSANAAEKDLRSMGVPPNGTFSYVWSLTTDDGPLEGDPGCLTQLYQSTVSLERDLASGLVGTLLICKHSTIDTRGRLLGPDKEWSLIFAVFDENRSWYFNENIFITTTKPCHGVTFQFKEILSVHGLVFFVSSKSDVAFWHVANVGTQSDFLSVYFTGNLFKYQGLYQSVLTLFPMTGVTVPMETELMGEWEISAYDGHLRSMGMSIRYSVLQSDDGDRVDRDGIPEDLFEYIDQRDLQPRGRRHRNHTALVPVPVCKNSLANNSTQPLNTTNQNGTCDQTEGSGDEVQGGIPQDILQEIERDGELTDSQNGNEPGREGGGRRRRQAEGNWTDVDLSSGASGYRGPAVEIGEDAVNRTEAAGKAKAEKTNKAPTVNNETNGEPKDGNEILQESDAQLKDRDSPVRLTNSEEMDQNLVPQSPIWSEPEQLTDLPHPEYIRTVDNNITTGIDMSLEYDDYNHEVQLFATDYLDLRSGTTRYLQHYIAAEEISWDYGIRKPQQLIRPKEMRRGMRKFLPRYKKVVFRAYSDKDFLLPLDRGEPQEHLGIMGPFIRAEINDFLTVVFKNKASRPYSFHLQGVYDLSQGAGKPVAPGEARTYNWRVTKKQGPSDSEFDCKTGAYYSTVDKEKDLNSGLIGPLVICKPGTLRTRQNTQPNVEEFALLFHSFDETKSWYLEENLRLHCTPPCVANTEDPWYHVSNTFAAINGYVAETVPGLLVAQHQLVRWHLLNVGSDGEYHAVHFHGLPFTVHTEKEHRMGIYNLFPGVFGTVEMKPPTVGTWLVECTIGDYQLAGMRAKLLVYNPHCVVPLGMKSGRIEDSQITASDHTGKKPRLARLEQSGYINAWIGTNNMSWLQVDLLRPTLLHGLQTQGVRSKLRDNYITSFHISYSLDQDTWTTYRGNRTKQKGVFYGYMDSSKVKNNLFSPPFVARYIRILPRDFVQRPALRLELLGCDLNSCSLPLGLQKKIIPDDGLSASSFHSSLLSSWSPSLARLHLGGRTNAWRPKNNNPHEWLQVDLGTVKRITGVVTQGARSLFYPMMVTEFSVTVSHDGHSWRSVLEDGSQREKIFTGNSDTDDEALTVFDPPLFGRYLRVHPRGWINDIALRLEVLGCDTQQEP
uniref:Coagulation factor VIII, procoagulant component n=1 Tax=Gasterosteus aculeatus aculeatus TaxID=481459 RepID=A0AAQ4QXA3_GASAC